MHVDVGRARAAGEEVQNKATHTPTKSQNSVSHATDAAPQTTQTSSSLLEAERDTAQYNSYLTWYREMYPARWDAGTGMYVFLAPLTHSWHVPKESVQYYKYDVPKTYSAMTNTS